MSHTIHRLEGQALELINDDLETGSGGDRRWSLSDRPDKRDNKLELRLRVSSSVAAAQLSLAK